MSVSAALSICGWTHSAAIWARLLIASLRQPCPINSAVLDPAEFAQLAEKTVTNTPS